MQYQKVGTTNAENKSNKLKIFCCWLDGYEIYPLHLLATAHGTLSNPRVPKVRVWHQIYRLKCYICAPLLMRGDLATTGQDICTDLN